MDKKKLNFIRSTLSEAVTLISRFEEDDDKDYLKELVDLKEDMFFAIELLNKEG